MERSLFSARHCFVENLWRSGKLADSEYGVLCEWFKFLTSSPKIDLGIDLIVYLRTKPEVAWERVKSRARSEEKVKFSNKKNLKGNDCKSRHLILRNFVHHILWGEHNVKHQWLSLANWIAMSDSNQKIYIFDQLKAYYDLIRTITEWSWRGLKKIQRLTEFRTSKLRQNPNGRWFRIQQQAGTFIMFGFLHFFTAYNPNTNHLSEYRISLVFGHSLYVCS